MRPLLETKLRLMREKGLTYPSWVLDRAGIDVALVNAESEVLRGWLEWQPEKVLFGTDAYSDENTPLADWEDKAWLMTATGREALAMALSGMIADGEITRERAMEIARMVLRENAVRLYGLQGVALSTVSAGDSTPARAARRGGSCR